MSSYQESTNAGKAARRGIAEQRQGPGKNKRPRPVVVESRRTGLLNRSWRRWGSYRTSAEAETMIANAGRKYPWAEFRIKPEPAGGQVQ